MNVCGIDPSSKGWVATVIKHDNNKFYWLESKKDSVEFEYKIDHFVIEEPKPGRHQAVIFLFKTALWSGIVAGKTDCRNFVTADVWRKWLTGKRNPKDSVVKECLSLLINNSPKRSNSHQRDAAGIACYWASLDRYANESQKAERTSFISSKKYTLHSK